MSGVIGNSGGKKGKSGRKTKGQELALVEWYESVLPTVFGIVKDKLGSERETDKLWAMEWLKAGIVKMIPQKLAGDKDNPVEVLVKFINGNQDN